MPRDLKTGFLTPGRISPLRAVTATIKKPEYVGNRGPAKYTGGDIYNAEEIELVRESGRIAARAIEEVSKHCIPGVSTDELDRIGHEFVLDHGAYPSALGYRGFPKSICTSLNEVICHGIPDDTILQDGDIINIDITAYKNGMHGDLNRTFKVGQVSEDASLLIERTEEALTRAIATVAPGRQINTIGRTIQAYAKRFNYGVVRDFTGHGVGRAFHTGLVIPHYDAAPAYSQEMQVGMIFTIEPMLTLGSYEWDMWKDDWTVTTRDKSLTAQFEHTMVVTESGADILTLA
ncbi:MAG: type methionyl aminopeptidase [Actinomycetota bacterium]|jgi:methionyl aminopeptidase